MLCDHPPPPYWRHPAAPCSAECAWMKLAEDAPYFVQLTKYLPDLFRAMGARQAVRLSGCQTASMRATAT